MIKEMPCITCPMSCHLQVTIENNEVVSVSGNTCPRGIKYAQNEITHPQRSVTTTVKIKHALHPLLPVITSKAVPKDKIFDIINVCNSICVDAPIQYNDVLLENVLNLGVNICASRTMNEVKCDESKHSSRNQ